MKVTAALFLSVLLFASCSDKDKSKKYTSASLNSNWEFRCASNLSRESRRLKLSKWRVATVPGTVHTDLFAHNLIPDPFFGSNEKELQWIEKEDWEYRCTFTVNADQIDYRKIEIAFNGLDTYADVYLNDSLIIKADNMFRSWNTQVRELIQPGINHLRVYFHSATKKARPQWTKYNGVFPAVNEKTDTVFSVYTRKSPYHYGWDWGPRYVGAGIWKDVNIHYWNDVKFESHHVKLQELTKKAASYDVKFDVKSSVNQKVDISLYLGSQRVERKTFQLNAGVNFCKTSFEIKNPKLWWPHGHGKAYLYQLKAELRVEDELIQTKKFRIGVRELELVQEADSNGRSFYFKVNGRPIFMKGANIIPGDNFNPRVTKNYYHKLINTAAQSHMNMLRVWGGGIYENDAFYDLCDEKGILIWQDFMFACAFYPADDDFAYTVKKEAVENVKRLRNHPCIALWCGNNEIEHGWSAWGWHKNYSVEDSTLMWNAYERIFWKILPDVINTYDPSRTYISSSPSGHVNIKNEVATGDQHEWKIWFGHQPFENYGTGIGRFVSEYGFQSYPSFQYCSKMTGVDSLVLESARLKAHQQCHMDWYAPGYTGNELIHKYMSDYFKIPKDEEKYMLLSQITQAKALQSAIESHRRNRPYTMGTLYWQLNDCWPAVSWSTIDYNWNWKLSHYTAKESFKPIILSQVYKNDTIYVYALSDSSKSVIGDMTFKLIQLDGKVLLDSAFTGKIAANSSKLIFKKNLKPFVHSYNKNNLVASSRCVTNYALLDEAEYYFVKPKDLYLRRPQIRSEVRVSGDNYLIVLNADSVVKNVCLFDGNRGGNFSTNNFDLMPKVEKIVTYKNKLNPENPEKNIRVLNLNDLQ